MWPFRPRPKRPSLTHSAHWDLTGVEFGRFFRALPSLLPLDSFLGLAEGAWSWELAQFLTRHAINLDAATLHVLPREFEDAAFLPVKADVMSRLATLAEHHAEPEVALHLVAGHQSAVLIEWYDAPDDPLAMAGHLEEAVVARFAATIHGSYCRADPGV